MKKRIFSTLTIMAVVASSLGLSISQRVYAEDTTVKVGIIAFVDGQAATAISANSNDFAMSATTGEFALTASGNDPYQTVIGDIIVGSDFTINERIDGTVVGAACTDNKPFSLVGYTTADSLGEAMAGTPSLTVPAFTAMTANKFVVVWNHDCGLVVPPVVIPETEGTIIGDVVGGAPHGVLEVTSVVATDTSAIADGTFASGWKYDFMVTVPNNETQVSMKFADWTTTPADGTLAAANNMRISSAQANNAGATVLITAANTYSSPTLTMTGDLDSVTPGNQVKITVEVAVPAATANGSYGTSYGIKTQ